ncbi:hypothetical protein PV326_009644, partial [Microctonus aethiopoides]
MYKIRLYVVPEQEENTEEDEHDDIKNLPIMQRKNSRRPGAIRVNVIQKTRKSTEDNHHQTNNNHFPIHTALIINNNQTTKRTSIEKHSRNKRTVKSDQRQLTRSSKIIRIKDEIDSSNSINTDQQYNDSKCNSYKVFPHKLGIQSSLGCVVYVHIESPTSLFYRETQYPITRFPRKFARSKHTIVMQFN